MDERFDLVKRDHRFRPIRQTQRKVQIDKRFQGIFFKKKFRESFTVDKRGRPIKESTSKNLRKFYHLSKEERKRIHKERLRDKEILQKRLKGSELGKENGEDTEFQESETLNGSQNVQKVSDDDESYSSYLSSEEDSDVDLARGKGNLESSSDEEDDAEFELNTNVPNHDWGEMDNKAPRSEVTSHRLALCSMDWDRVTAADIFVLLDSFKPTRGVIKSVVIYPSNFGTERMNNEVKSGPAELKEMRSDEQEDEWNKDDDQNYNMEKLRQYEINRLKYYYAVIVCDSVNTAEKIYAECDGLEFETSCSKLDLRFIPNDMEFNDYPPKEEISAMPDLLTYKPASFITAALNQTKVDLTWDETDHKRIALTKNKFSKEQLENMDVKDFLASDSESGEEVNDGEVLGEGGDLSEKFDQKSKMDEQERVELYRKLLLGDLENDEKEKDDDVDMEITWEPDLKLKIEQDIAITKPKKTKKADKKQEDASEIESTSKAELEMIMLGDGDQADEDGTKFEIDVNDERFSAVYKSSRYAVDRSDSAFRKSDGMEKFIQERQSRLEDFEEERSTKKNQDVVVSGKRNDTLSQLVKSVKTKSAWLDKRKNK